MTVISVSPSIAPVLENVDAPLASSLFVATYVKRTILPSDIDLLTTPSPKYTSNFPDSTSCKKKTELSPVN